MSSNPSFQFYPADWTRDTRKLSLPAKGAWIDLICEMHWSRPRGEITVTWIELSRILGCTNTLYGDPEEQAKDIIWELIVNDICDHKLPVDNTVKPERSHNEATMKPRKSLDDHNEITLMSRRIVNEERVKESNRKRQERKRVTQKSRRCHENVTFPSSSSSSSSDLNTKDFVPVDSGDKPKNGNLETRPELKPFELPPEEVKENLTRLKSIVRGVKQVSK